MIIESNMIGQSDISNLMVGGFKFNKFSINCCIYKYIYDENTFKKSWLKRV